MIAHAGWLLFILSTAMVASVVLQKLTWPAALLGGAIGLCVYAGAGFTGLALLGAFFCLGVAATRFKKEWKEKNGLSKKSDQKRTAGQVAANGGVAAIAGLMALALPQHAHMLQVMLAASLASATADTLSSELGMVYGRRFFNIWTFEKDARGLDGVVSWEGTLIGIGGSLLIALIFAVGLSAAFFCILFAGTAGNLFDSVLGATLERQHSLNNNAVNFLNTLVAALVAALLAQVV